MRNARVLFLSVAACSLLATLGATSEPATKPTTTTAPVAATAPAAATTQAAVDASKLDAQGYIKQWLILGPINFGDDYNAEDIEKDQIKDEAKLTPKEGDKQKVSTNEGEPGAYKKVEKELTWKAAKTTEYFFDLNEILKMDSSDSCGAYAVVYLDAPEEMKDIKFSLSSNDNGKIYLNGAKIFSYVGGRGLSEDSDVVEKLTLKKGINVVIFKVWNDTNNWQGCIRLLTKDDKPVKDVKVQLTKDAVVQLMK